MTLLLASVNRFGLALLLTIAILGSVLLPADRTARFVLPTVGTDGLALLALLLALLLAVLTVRLGVADGRFGDVAIANCRDRVSDCVFDARPFDG